MEFLTERRLQEALKAAEQGSFDLSIIDTPPAAGPQAFTAAQAADLILIPCLAEPGRSRCDTPDRATRKVGGRACIRRFQRCAAQRHDVT